MENKFQVAIIGGGPGGYVAAIRGAQLGLKVALIEEKELGGTCLNKGCVPVKALLHSANLYEEAKDFSALGLHAENLSYDIHKMHERKREISEKLRNGVNLLLKSNKVTVFQGRGTLLSKDRILIEGQGKEEITAEHIILATGSFAVKPPVEGMELEGVMTSDELISYEEKVPASLVIVGGGVIGMEFATFYSALGTEVTVVEMADRVIPTLDKEIAKHLTMTLKKKGVTVFTSARVEKITKAEDGKLKCHFMHKEKEKSALGELILVSTGRRAYTESLGLENTQVETERGRILVDENYETKEKGIYAVGDAIGGIQLAHVASAEGLTAISHIAGEEAGIRMDVVPSCVYTMPEIATVGLTEEEAADKGFAVVSGKFPLQANGKALIEGQAKGFVKIVADEKTDVVLGAQLYAVRATDMIGELSLAVAKKLTVTEVTEIIHPHPTVAEAIFESMEDVHGRAIHMVKSKR